MFRSIKLSVLFLFLFVQSSFSQTQYELNSNWKCLKASETRSKGEEISSARFNLKNWKAALVPGTVLGSQLMNKEIPDPFYGMNNEQIPDIYNTGRDYYTYWFVKDFTEANTDHKEVWLHFRGVNYSCDIFLNGKKLNSSPQTGMFLRHTYNISSLLNTKGMNRLAVIVYPPDPVGNPNGGQGGDGRIAKNVGSQYTAGWDWIQPMRDRNTGIWDKVIIEKTGSINLKNPHIITAVPGKRLPGTKQMPARISASAELQNSSSTAVKGRISFKIDGKLLEKEVTIAAGSSTVISLPDLSVENPRLWWPNGYGEQFLYPAELRFTDEQGELSDEEKLQIGIREIQTSWNTHTRSREIWVNGQPIFIKGGNWIISDAMLRFSAQRYDAEVRFHRDMNLNLIRIWGGSIPERPEFFEACDKYGLLVMQDFAMSGDCNGRWLDPMKAEDQWTRRKYPDDHQLFLESAADVVRMLRNHASLAAWCGGNEITPPEDILLPLRDSILPQLDGTRWFVDYSNSDSMSYNFLGGNGDGPYGIQKIETFWQERTFPFNSEVGSVGVGDYVSLQRFIPEKNMIAPQYPSGVTDSVWAYHKYIGYNEQIAAYADVKDAREFAEIAQLVNYDQYRALAEGFSAHMWDWYTGFIIWKTQNPWTAMRGQMYDYYLDPNACLYGLRTGAEPLHVMANPETGMVMMVNNGFNAERNLMLRIRSFDLEGKEKLLTQVFTYINAMSVKKILSVENEKKKLAATGGGFLLLELLDEKQRVKSRNMYWLADGSGNYAGLLSMKKTNVIVTVSKLNENQVLVKVQNPGGQPVAFFNRVSLLDAVSNERVLPAFYDNNYLSVAPGETESVVIDYPAGLSGGKFKVSVEGCNVSAQSVQLH